MRETSIMNNFNCKMQACAKSIYVCEENIELEEKTMPIETIFPLKV